MGDHLGGAVQRAHVGDAGDGLAVPLHLKLELLVRVDAMRVDSELGHRHLLFSSACSHRCPGEGKTAGTSRLIAF